MHCALAIATWLRIVVARWLRLVIQRLSAAAATAARAVRGIQRRRQRRCKLPLLNHQATNLPRRIHIVGASGSGTTSLAAAIAATHGHRHLDIDDFFWLRTDPPYRQRRAREERLAMLHRALGKAPAWVLSGSLCEWGDPLIPAFELVVFLIVPSEVRMARLRAREVQRYGAETIAPGGAFHQAHVDFLDWAAGYDEGGLEIRSRALHDAWLARLPCPVLKLEADRPIIELLSEVEAGFDPRR